MYIKNYDLIKSNKYSAFSSGDSIPKNRKCECTNEAQTNQPDEVNRLIEKFIGEIKEQNPLVKFHKN